MTDGDPNEHVRSPSSNDEAERRKAKIRALNDALRTERVGGEWFVTPGVQQLGGTALATIIRRVQSFSAFSHANDPYGLHDFGSFEASGHMIFWKIDCYDRRYKFESADPSDPRITKRVITILLASEY